MRDGIRRYEPVQFLREEWKTPELERDLNGVSPYSGELSQLKS